MQWLKPACACIQVIDGGSGDCCVQEDAVPAGLSGELMPCGTVTEASLCMYPSYW